MNGKEETRVCAGCGRSLACVFSMRLVPIEAPPFDHLMPGQAPTRPTWPAIRTERQSLLGFVIAMLALTAVVLLAIMICALPLSRLLEQ